ncbi:hypothetical protein [Streptomyces barkulensis]|uniref:hypothetical protein n=1 Tax=Streptomyces barkulensis TaxID=1257026 RepID=UPI000C6DE3F9|nr:hypothetical protein [Streptomyces barkulensis]
MCPAPARRRRCPRPIDKGPLTLSASGDVLYNPRLRRRCPIVDGVPRLLPSSGEAVGREEYEELCRRSAT